jgi:large subunit ribosomal protein L3
MAGHMGTLTVTIQNLEIVAVDVENNAILVKGNIPGAKNSLVVIKTSVKNPGKVNEAEGLNIFESSNENVVTEETPMVDENAELEATEEETTEEVTIEDEVSTEEAEEEVK